MSKSTTKLVVEGFGGGLGVGGNGESGVLGSGQGFAHWRNAAKEQMSKGAKWSLVGRIAGLGVCGIGGLLAKIGDLRGGQK